jgi:hypothetical protein
MNSEATEAALALLRLPPNNILVPLKRPSGSGREDGGG